MQYIEELIDREEILKEITEQNNTFDISVFYLGDRDGNGAVGILTPNQTIYNYSVLEHGNVVEKILAEIYSDFKEFNVKLRY